MKYSLALLVLARGALGQPSCALEGSVADQSTGRPLAKVHIFAIQDSQGTAIRTYTNQQGVFCFERLQAGSYTLLARRTGYLDAVYQGSRFFGGSPRLKIGPNDKLSALNLKMAQRSILAGRIVDSEGDPIVGAEVRAQGPEGDAIVWRDPGNITRTDVHGTFRFYDLDPGTYRLIAAPPLEPRFFAGYRDGNGHPLQAREIETYYPNASSADGAEPISLTAGREITGLVVTLQRVSLRHISGRVVGLPFREYLLADLRRPSGGVESRAIQLQKDGTFYQDGLLPGIYTIRMTGAESRIVDLTIHDLDGLTIEPPKASQ